MRLKSKLATNQQPLFAGQLRTGWMLALLLVLCAMFWVVAWYSETALSTVAIWQRSQTFAHGFLIFPISIYLIWTQRRSVATLNVEPNLWVLGWLVLVGFTWLVADLAGALVIKQYSLVIMLALLVWIILGNHIARALTFPLLFLLLAVPFGEIFLPQLMEFTADFTISALQLTGIPVYREGLFFTIPSGRWSVVEACSGLRYLIASFTLGCLYAYLSYRSPWRRVIFILASVIVPIIANGMRAYMIVMIGHLSGMELAVGIDHYIYGWVFFGLVMLLLFWIGSFWREDGIAIPHTISNLDAQQSRQSMPWLRMVPVAVMAVVVTAIWPIYATHLKNINVFGAPALSPPQTTSTNGWQATPQRSTDWTPHYLNTSAHIHQTYTKGDHTLSLFIGYYNNQQQGNELISAQNSLVPSEDKAWSIVGEADRMITHGKQQIAIRQTMLRGANARLLAWHWFWIEGRYTSNPLLAKLLEAKSRLAGHGDDAAVIILYSPYDDRPEDAAAAMQDFVNDMLPAIGQNLANANQD